MIAARLRPLAALAVLFALLCAPLVLSTGNEGYAWDETQYHVPAVRQIRAHWPKLDISADSLSATAPGYHYVLAGVSMLTGQSVRMLRIVNWAVSLLVLWQLLAAFPRTEAALALAAVLPLAASNFFVKSASWVVTDNAALCATAAALLQVLAPQPNVRRLSWAAIFSALAVLIRQINAWLVAPLALRTIVAGPKSESATDRLGRWIPPLLPIATLAYLVWSWHGLVPPAWSEVHRGNGSFSAGAITMLLVVTCTFAPFYLGAMTPQVVSLLRTRWFWLAVIIGTAWGLYAPTNFDPAADRWGGYWWTAARFLPAPGKHSVVLVPLAGFGAGMIALMVRLLDDVAGRTSCLLWTVSLVAWAASTLPNHRLFQRYFEPTVLVFLIFWLALMLRNRREKEHVARWPLYAATGIQLVLTLATAYYNTFSRPNVIH